MTKAKQSKYFNLLGEPVSKQFVYLGVVGIIVFVAAILGGGYYLMAKDRGSVPYPLSVRAEPLKPVVLGLALEREGNARELASESALTASLRILLEQHVMATGLDGVKGYILNGEVSIEGNTWNLMLMGREPNLYKLKTESPDAEQYFESGYDGQSGWLRQSHDPLKQAESAFYMSMAVLESSLAHLAWSYRLAAVLEGGLDSVLELRTAELWNGQHCAVVVSRGILPFSITHYIDTDTFEEVYRRAMVPGMDGAVAEIELHFTPADGSSPYRLPMGYELYVDGKLHDTVTYTRARVNRMMLSSLFDVPADGVIHLGFEQP
ncbi:MAG: hypothetical protein ACI8ZW_001803 [Yoonia sp.]|jgi:hypothetical protein